MNRRDFVVCGSGAALALAAGAWTEAWSRARAGAGPAPGPPAFTAIFDSRFPESLEFGKSAARFGCESWPIRGDVTDLWLRQLRPLWARGEGAVVGMTSAVSFLCIQQLAADFWMRVVARVEHVPPLNAARLDGTPWAASLVVPLVRALDRPPQSPPARAVAVTRHSPIRPSRMPLVSWAIAPRKEVPT